MRAVPVRARGPARQRAAPHGPAQRHARKRPRALHGHGRGHRAHEHPLPLRRARAARAGQLPRPDVRRALRGREGPAVGAVPARRRGLPRQGLQSGVGPALGARLPEDHQKSRRRVAQAALSCELVCRDRRPVPDPVFARARHGHALSRHDRHAAAQARLPSGARGRAPARDAGRRARGHRGLPRPGRLLRPVLRQRHHCHRGGAGRQRPRAGHQPRLCGHAVGVAAGRGLAAGARGSARTRVSRRLPHLRLRHGPPRRRHGARQCPPRRRGRLHRLRGGGRAGIRADDRPRRHRHEPALRRAPHGKARGRGALHRLRRGLCQDRALAALPPELAHGV